MTFSGHQRSPRGDYQIVDTRVIHRFLEVKSVQYETIIGWRQSDDQLGIRDVMKPLVKAQRFSIPHIDPLHPFDLRKLHERRSMIEDIEREAILFTWIESKK